ncbi:hypothetical protein G3480_09955 [Thiorhodococcus mannitoliphagus]|uniref:Uncharacterized protein n=1 Tax=Thiorhodococcus mannitoliphagus TaxID=329406 RepID=A0A6P1DRF1_9GAMM|nr:hypothetical protein [Thiorhodococcus mannitoliphagus]NEX20628.1 hypothetical protein [Thiorhodococcus mannitoliphagus]
MFLLLVFLGAVAGNVAAETPAEAMARAIARMMESMGFAGAAGYDASAYPKPGVMPGLPTPMGAWSGSGIPTPPASGADGSPMDQMTQMGQQMLQGVQGQAASAPWGQSSLEGVWEDNQSGVLIVQGGRYRLYSQCRGYIEGAIRISGSRVELSNDTQEGMTQGFEYVLDQGRLVLRNESGQVFLYRRLILSRER